MPTSFILRDAFAVDKFMKLMQASTSMKTAIIEKRFTYSILTPACTPFSYTPRRYRSEYLLINKVALDSGTLDLMRLAIFLLNWEISVFSCSTTYAAGPPFSQSLYCG